MKVFKNNEGHYFAIGGGRVVAHDVLPWDAADEIRNATPCDRDEYYRAVIAGLSQQISDVAESLPRVPGDKLVIVFSQLADSISADLSFLIQTCHVERECDRLHGEITRSKSDDQKSQLRAELVRLPRLRRRDSARCGYELVKPTQPPPQPEQPELRARDVGEQLGISPDAVMRLSLRNALARPTYQDGSPLWRQSDVDQYKEQHQ